VQPVKTVPAASAEAKKNIVKKTAKVVKEKAPKKVAKKAAAK
jgi:hypothetical protein